MSKEKHGTAEMKVAEAAELFGVTTRTIQRWIKSGYLTARAAGPTATSPLLISRESIDKLREQLSKSE